MCNLNNEITTFLNQQDCHIIGFADLRCLSEEVRQKFEHGILIGLSYTKEAIEENKNGLPQRYYTELKAMNQRLNELAALTADFLIDKGYKALPKIQSMVVQDKEWRTVLPHKTVATLAGIGWIGKCATLVTKEAGSALRITVVLTNAPLSCGEPIRKSLCSPGCMICANVCPGKAPRGSLWEAGMDRDEFFDAHACAVGARDRAKELLGIHETICGLCIVNCPFTKKGLGKTV